ncbi:MAG: PAS domain-containing sensor histidine kinase [Gammaproteobacteria bacterium]|nr:PAS domain-containing sensor histidine kinase [Gammaproteobacteria bacterium]
MLSIYGVTADVVPETFLLSNRLVVGITEEAGSVFSDWSTDTIVYSLSWLLVSILIIYLVYLYTIREKYLLESESRFRDFTDTASDWIWEMDAELRFSYLSEQFFNLANFQPQDLIGKRRWEYTSAESAGVTEEAWQAHRRLMEEHQPFRDFRYNVKDAAGIEHSISLSGNPVFLHDQFMGYRGTGANITALVAALNKAQEAQKKAEAASEAKSEFLSSMSHELRTPMNAILGYAQILQMTVDDPEHKDSIRIMLESGRHLMELINDVLDLSVIEAEQIQYHLEPVNVTLLLQECNALCQPLAIERGATVELEAGELSESCCVSADVVRLKQALLNYLSNAIKYGKQHDGVIRVVASQQKQNVRIAVIDNGVGISAEKISQLFLPFNRLGLEGGTVLGAGLGLSITKKIIELMGGVVGVQSEAGKGAEFWLELPACEISIEAEVAEK